MIHSHRSSAATAAGFDMNPHDGEALQRASATRGAERHFLDFRLAEETASAREMPVHFGLLSMTR